MVNETRVNAIKALLEKNIQLASDENLRDELIELVASNCSDAGFTDEELEQAIEQLNSNSVQEEYTVPQIELMRVRDLQAKDIKHPPFLIDKMLPVGCGILAGPPKAGKSWLSLNLAIDLSDGLPFLGAETNKCGAVYLALEDSAARLQERTNKILGHRKASPQFYVSLTAPKTNEGLLDQIATLLEMDSSIRLIIVDTYQKVRKPQGRSTDQYESGYSELSDLHQFAVDNEVCILLVHHAKKGNGFESDNPYDSILGSVSLQGATDFMITMKKGKDGTTLFGTGRDFEEFEYQLYFNADTCEWINLGAPDEIKKQEMQRKYRNDEAVKFIKDKLDMYGEYEMKADDMRREIAYNVPLEVASASEFGKYIGAYDSMFQSDGIKHTTKRCKDGMYHRFEFET